jgi:hypothetical protein
MTLRNEYRFLVGKSEVSRPLRRYSNRLDENNKIELKTIG